MNNLCRCCCKIFCKYRDNVTECNKQITFVTQMLQKIDKEANNENNAEKLKLL